MARPSLQQTRILGSLRTSIVKGTYAPGARLPTRSALEKKYGSSPATVQRVFHALAREGYVVSRGCKGTMVSAAPPHLHKFWLVFQSESTDVASPFRQALALEAQRFSGLSRDVVEIHVGHGGHFRQGKYRKLLHDVATHGTAGLVFASAGDYWGDTPLKDEPGIPRVVLSHGPHYEGDNAVVRLQTGSFVDRALDALHAEGRRRPAVVTCALSPAYLCRLTEGAKRRGMQLRPYWVQTLHWHSAREARNLVHLLMNDTQRVRPDSLILMDDSLVTPAVAGLQDAGVRVPKDATVIAHANFPDVVRSDIPLRYLGYELGDLLERSLDVLRRQREGKRYPKVTRIEPIFAEERG